MKTRLYSRGVCTMRGRALITWRVYGARQFWPLVSSPVSLSLVVGSSKLALESQAWIVHSHGFAALGSTKRALESQACAPCAISRPNPHPFLSTRPSCPCTILRSSTTHGIPCTSPTSFRVCSCVTITHNLSIFDLFQALFPGLPYAPGPLLARLYGAQLVVSGQQSDAAGICFSHSSAAGRLVRRVVVLSSRPATSAAVAGWAAQASRGFAFLLPRGLGKKKESQAQDRPAVARMVIFLIVFGMRPGLGAKRPGWGGDLPR